MAVPLLSELREPPVVGRFYMVPAVPFIWCGIDAVWPVLGPLHTDKDFFNFDRAHYHVDARFVSKRIASRASIHGTGIFAQAQRSPLARRNVDNPVEVPTGRPRLHKFKCQSSSFPYHFHHQPTVSDLRLAYGDRSPTQRAKPIRKADGRLLCPHRKVDLSQFEPDADGVVTCPLHGLRVCVRDSDEHRHGEDPKGLSGEAMPARAEGIAQPLPQSGHNHD